MELTALTSNEAVSMPEATQRTPSSEFPTKKASLKKQTGRIVSVDYSDSINFKVSPAFKQRFRLSAAKADLKLNELLFEAFEAWEAKQK
jgi:hypothetical protein